MPSAALIVAVAAPAVAFVLLIAVVVRKARRDRVERRSGARRGALATATGAELPALVARCIDGRTSAQTDLLAVLRRADPATRARLAAAAAAPAARRLVAVSAVDRDPVARGRGLLIGAWLGEPTALQTAVRLLRDPDGDVRLAACAALEALGSRAAAQALIEALHGGVVPHARIVERLAAQWAVAPLVDALATAPPGAARTACLRALGLAGDAAAAPAIAGLLVSTDPEERISAARALGQLGDATRVPALVGALGDEAWEVRAQAARALGDLGATDAVDALEGALTDRAWWVRANAARGLAGLGAAGQASLRRAAAGSDRYAAERAGEELQLLAVQSR